MSKDLETIDAKHAMQRFKFSRQFFYNMLNDKKNNVREYKIGKRRFEHL